MQRFELFFTQAWYVQMSTWEKELTRTSVELFAREERLHSFFADYAFVVFPMAKAYEGFLKRYFYNLQLISLVVFNDKHFRIGRSLNPDIHPDRRGEDWIYDAVAKRCGSEIARTLWEVWLTCRNQLFHFFPDNERRLDLVEAGQHLEKIAAAMEEATRCQQQL